LGLLLWACDGDDDGETNAGETDTGIHQGEGGSGGSIEPEGLEVWISPVEKACGGQVELEVGCRGDVQELQLSAGDQLLATVSAEGENQVISWDASAFEDGELSLILKAVGPGGELESEPVTVTIDNTPPEAELALSRWMVLEGNLNLDFEAQDAHLEQVRLLGPADLAVEAEGEELRLDTSLIEDGVVELQLEVTDEAGNQTLTPGIKVFVVNNGREVPVDYATGQYAEVPENYRDVEYHARVYAVSEPNVKRVISILTWKEDWSLEYAFGQGFCPHRGTTYLREVSDSGEILIDFGKSDMTSVQRASLPADARDGDSFPHNDDPATYGSFFAHIDPLEPAEHVGKRIEIEVRMIYLYE